MPEIKACPNPECRYEKPNWLSHTDSDEEYWYIVCGRCQMAGPTGGSLSEAIDLWNNLPRKGDF